MTSVLVERLKRMRRIHRTKRLRTRNPDGAFLRIHGLHIFCNFTDPNYVWYDTSAPNLALDRKVMSALIRQVPGDTCIDIGAHFGFFTACMAEALKSKGGGGVVAIEPDPHVLKCLSRTADAYRATDVAIDVCNVAVTAATGRVLLQSGAGSCVHTYATPGSVTVSEVQGRSLDSILDEKVPTDRKVAVVKIDVDGAEPQVLAGGLRTLANHRPALVIEFSPAQLEAASNSPQALFAELCHLGSVHALDYRTSTVVNVGPSDYERVSSIAYGTITDLVVCDSSIDLDAL